MNVVKMLALSTVLTAGMVMAQAPATTAPAPAPTKQAKTVAAAPSASDIAAAKAKNMVWVNLNSKVYHMSDNKFYGATKNGKFMTEADAKAAGYKAAKDAPAKAATK